MSVINVGQHSSTLWISTPNFFVQASLQTVELRWHQRFDLAWNGKGLFINLKDVPDDILTLMVEWTNEAIEKENAEMRK